MAIALRLRSSGLLLAVVCVALSGCDTTPKSAANNPRLPSDTSSASLRPSDSLTISIQSVPDPSSNQVQVDDKGLITLPFIGSVKAAGNTTAELSQRIREIYIEKKIYTAVDVSVSVTDRFVYVGGEVIRGGRIVWTPDLTVTKAIQAAGGFTLYAGETDLQLVRDNILYVINAKLAKKKPSEDPRLMPGDSIDVKKSHF